MEPICKACAWENYEAKTLIYWNDSSLFTCSFSESIKFDLSYSLFIYFQTIFLDQLYFSLGEGF